MQPGGREFPALALGSWVTSESTRPLGAAVSPAAGRQAGRLQARSVIREDGKVTVRGS